MLAAYRTPMAQWSQRAFVRGREDAPLALGLGRLPFSPALFPLAVHPLVKELGDGASDYLLAQRLYAYLDWTVELETRVVAPVSYGLAEHQYGLPNDPSLIEDALKIACDEAYHALDALETRRKVVESCGVQPVSQRIVPTFLAALEKAKSDSPPDRRGLVPLIFAIVSETLITATLTRLPNDPDVDPLVRRVVLHHALDEAQHHAVYSRILEMLWDRWSEDQRSLHAPLLARFIEAFLAPDVGAARSWLLQLGVTEKVAAGIVEDVYAPSEVLRDMRLAAAPSLESMRRAGLFENAVFVDALGERGLN